MYCGFKKLCGDGAQQIPVERERFSRMSRRNTVNTGVPAYRDIPAGLAEAVAQKQQHVHKDSDSGRHRKADHSRASASQASKSDLTAVSLILGQPVRLSDANRDR